MRNTIHFIARWASLGLAGLLIQDYFHGLELGRLAWPIAFLLIAALAVFVLTWPKFINWLAASIPFRITRIDGSPTVQSGPLRVALFAVRSELAACAIRINEARARKTWWDPDQDPLPAAKWDQHFATLSDAAVPDALNAKMERTYQECDRLNHLIRRRLAQWESNRASGSIVQLPRSFTLNFRQADDQRLHDLRRLIDETNTEISQLLAAGR